MKLPAKKIILVLLPLLIVGGAVIWWLMPTKLPLENRYVTAPVERGSITQTVSANGTLNPVKLVNVGSQVSGIVKKLYVDFKLKNSFVKSSIVLIKFARKDLKTLLIL